MEEQQQFMTAETPSILQRKIGHYVLLRELGRGGAATVYKAIDTRDNTVVALKALASVPYNQDEDQMSLLVRMERETRAVEGLSHPHIVRIIDVGFAGDSPENLIPYFAMEFLSGETLRQRMDRDGALTLPIAAKILDQAADALDAVHASGIIHRDVKPGNLMLMKDNFVKLMDFGIARQNDDATVTRAGMMVGSPAYMSPGAGGRRVRDRGGRRLGARRSPLRDGDRYRSVRRTEYSGDSLSDSSWGSAGGAAKCSASRRRGSSARIESRSSTTLLEGIRAFKSLPRRAGRA